MPQSSRFIDPVSLMRLALPDGRRKRGWFWRRLSAMRQTFGNEIFFARSDGDTFVVDNQRIAALYDDHVLVEFMHVRG